MLNHNRKQPRVEINFKKPKTLAKRALNLISNKFYKPKTFKTLFFDNELAKPHEILEQIR